MTKRAIPCSILLGFAYLVSATAQYPMLDTVATKVIQKYQQATCEDLWKQKTQPKSQMEQDMVKLLKDDPKMRAAFLAKVAAPIANKMFECGMIP